MRLSFPSRARSGAATSHSNCLMKAKLKDEMQGGIKEFVQTVTKWEGTESRYEVGPGAEGTEKGNVLSDWSLRARVGRNR